MVETQGHICVELPIEKEFARLLRLMVSGIASRMNFDLDAVDDLKIAVEEAYLMAMRRHVESPIKVIFNLENDRLLIDFKGVGGKPSEGENQQNDGLGNFILEAVVDEMHANESSPEFDLRLVKYLQEEHLA